MQKVLTNLELGCIENVCSYNIFNTIHSLAEYCFYSFLLSQTFIEGGLDQQSNLITTGITSVTSSVAPSVSTSNVIVEPMPYSLSHMDTVIMDIEHEFGNLVNMSDPELAVDGFLDW